MAANNNSERIGRLKVYAEKLQQQLAGQVPAKHKDSVAAWKQMIEIDLKKTLATIDSLKIG